MTKKNLGPCAIKECNKPTNHFRTFTINCKNKAIAKGTYDYYNIEIGLQLCHDYLAICEPDHHINYNEKKKRIKNNDKENHITRNRNPTNYYISGKLK